MSCIKTKVVIISDTHGKSFGPGRTPAQQADVVIHCGDLTHCSKLDKFRQTLQLLRSFNAPIKLAIAGTHDFTLDQGAFDKKINEAIRLNPELKDDQELIDREFGKPGEARQLMLDAAKDGIIFLEEGDHQIQLKNGAVLNIYASPYTPTHEPWGFSYSPAEEHDFSIGPNTDIVVPHGPPRGIMDLSADKARIGCPQLFAAVARSKPQIHCFGHVHGGWGAKAARWRPQISETPNHFADIDNSGSSIITSLIKLRSQSHQQADDVDADEQDTKSPQTQSCYEIPSPVPEADNATNVSTLFVNAALDDDGELAHLPFLVKIELPAIHAKHDVTDDTDRIKLGLAPPSTVSLDPRGRKRKNTGDHDCSPLTNC